MKSRRKERSGRLAGGCGAFLSKQEVDAASDALRRGSLRAQLPAIYQNCGRSDNSQRGGLLRIGSNATVHLGAVHVPVEALDVQSQVARISNEDRTRISFISPRFLVAVKPVVHFPEVILSPSRFGRMGSSEGVFVNFR